MFVYRAKTSCPVCNTPSEVWIQSGKVVPLDIIECLNCEQLFEGKDFISSFIELRTNATISSRSYK
jgi:transcription elongation factor Elf1